MPPVTAATVTHIWIRSPGHAGASHRARDDAHRLPSVTLRGAVEYRPVAAKTRVGHEMAPGCNLRPMAKTVFLGAGSTVFARNLLGDILGYEELAGSEIVLLDIDAERLNTSELVRPTRSATRSTRRPRSPLPPIAAPRSTAPTTRST